MVSPELLRRHTFFSGLSSDQLTMLAKAADELTMEDGSYLFHEGENLHSLYLVLEGRIAITLTLPEVGSRAIIPMPNAQLREVVVSTVGAGAVFAWSALVPPYLATSNGKVEGRSRLIALDCRDLRESFEHDPYFGYLMLVKVAQVARDRLQDLHYESLAQRPI